MRLRVTRDVVEHERFDRIGLVRMAEAYVAAFAQHHLLATELHFGLAFDGHERPVRALIDDDELVAPPLDPGVLAGGEARRAHELRPCDNCTRATRIFGRVVSVVSSAESSQTSSMIAMSLSLPLTVITSTSRTRPRSSGDNSSAVDAVRIT